jgi:hypothetical protein
MARPDLRVRADALRAEAAAARVQAKDAYFKRVTELELERSRVATAKDSAEHSAWKAAERSKDASSDAARSGGDASRLGQEAQGEARRGDAREAEETTELSDYMNRSSKVAQELERQATLDAAKFRQEAAGHDVRLKELEYEVRSTNGRNSTTEQHLDRLEDQARLYDEASRKFAAAEATDNIPERAQFELEAEKALRDADAIQVDRAAIRVFVPDLPAVTPGLPPTPMASIELGDDSTADAAVAAVDDDLGLDFTAAATAHDSVGSDIDPSVASAENDSSDSSSAQGFSVDSTATEDSVAVDMPAMTDTLDPAVDTAPVMDELDSFGFDAPAGIATESFEPSGDTFDA